MKLLRSGFRHLKTALLQHASAPARAARQPVETPANGSASKHSGPDTAETIAATDQHPLSQLVLEHEAVTLEQAERLETVRNVQACQQNDTYALGKAREHLSRLHEMLAPEQRTQVLAKLVHRDLAYMAHELRGMRKNGLAIRHHHASAASLKALQESIYPGSLRTLLLEVTREAILVCLTGTLTRASSPVDSALVINALGGEGRLAPALIHNLLTQMPMMLAQDRQAIARLLALQPLLGPMQGDAETARQRGADVLTLLKNPKVETEIKGSLLKALAPGCDFDNMKELSKACARCGLEPERMEPLLSAIRNHPLPISPRALEVNYVVLVVEAGRLGKANRHRTIRALRDAWVMHLERTGMALSAVALDRLDRALLLAGNKGVGRNTMI